MLRSSVTAPLFQEKVKGAVPFETVRFIDPSEPPWQVASVTETAAERAAGGWLIVTVAVDIQPLLSVTVTI